MTPVIVDLSHWDTMETDGFGKLFRAGFRGVINKATEGASGKDDTYLARRRDCAGQAPGMKWGAYHFSRRGDGAQQADHFLAFAQPTKDDLIALDWESAVGEKGGYSDCFTCEQARAFLDRIMDKTGRKPQEICIYGGNVLKELITTAADMAYFGQFRLWLCQYAARAKLPKAWDRYDMWQYTETGTAPGVMHSGGVDCNVVRDGFDWDTDWGAPPQSSQVVAANTVSISQLAQVSRKVSGMAWFKRGWQGISVAGILSSLGMAQSTADQVGEIVRDHWLAILITTAILVILFIKWLESLTVQDVQAGRYTPSGKSA